MSLALSGLISGASNISSICAISSMMRSMSMRPIFNRKTPISSFTFTFLFRQPSLALPCLLLGECRKPEKWRLGVRASVPTKRSQWQLSRQKVFWELNWVPTRTAESGELGGYILGPWPVAARYFAEGTTSVRDLDGIRVAKRSYCPSIPSLSSAQVEKLPTAWDWSLPGDWVASWIMALMSWRAAQGTASLCAYWADYWLQCARSCTVMPSSCRFTAKVPDCGSRLLSPLPKKALGCGVDRVVG